MNDAALTVSIKTIEAGHATIYLTGVKIGTVTQVGRYLGGGWTYEGWSQSRAESKRVCATRAEAAHALVERHELRRDARRIAALAREIRNQPYP